jgi:hypothetical protein
MGLSIWSGRTTQRTSSAAGDGGQRPTAAGAELLSTR